MRMDRFPVDMGNHVFVLTAAEENHLPVRIFVLRKERTESREKIKYIPESHFRTWKHEMDRLYTGESSHGLPTVILSTAVWPHRPMTEEVVGRKTARNQDTKQGKVRAICWDIRSKTRISRWAPTHACKFSSPMGLLCVWLTFLHCIGCNATECWSLACPRKA